jgi:hypothetical protein
MGRQRMADCRSAATARPTAATPWWGGSGAARTTDREAQRSALTHASVATPLPPIDADDERRLIEPWGLKEAKPPWELGHAPPNHARAVQGHVLCTRLLFALATA